VGQLTGGLAHDFNNLLSTISMSLELIRRRAQAGNVDELEGLIQRADRSVKRAAALTHRMLAFSRQQVLDVRQIDVNALALGMEELMRRTLGEHVVLNLALDDGLWPALTDSNQLENALLNLAINARDAMPDGGRLTIETAPLHVSGGGVPGAPELRAGDYVVIGVTDTGTGMPPDVVAKAFDPFFTTKAVGQGSGLGLGLAMIYGFAKQSGGQALIYSRVGEGTSVKLLLPRAQGSEAQAAPDDAHMPTLRGTGESILLVEDEPDLRAALAVALSDLGYRPIETADAQAALAVLSSDCTVDLLVTDLGLPDMSGRLLAERARQGRPALKVLFISGYAKGTVVRGDLVLEGMDMLFKPFPMEALAHKVRAMTLPTTGERRRLLALYALEVLDSPEELAFDDLVRMAASVCGTPTALVSLVDLDRQWFKARFGLAAKQTPREVAFCAYAVQSPGEVMVVNDASADPRFSANPLVTGNPNIRFYAGAPLVTGNGEAIGTLCVIDAEPREISGAQIEELRFLARQVMQKLEERRAPRS
jgi:DNA-binding response OmpR family regulator